MAKYAVGYLLVLLFAALLVVAFTGFGVFAPDRFGGGGVAMPLPAPPPVAEPEPDPEPPDLVVVSADGRSVNPAVKWCWTDGPGTLCGQVFDSGEQNVYTSTVDQGVELELPMIMDLTMSVEGAGSCPGYDLKLGSVSTVSLERLGPAGDYSISLTGVGDNANATWLFEIDNQTDLPLPEGVSC